jgi:ketohexokinase
MLSSTIGAGDTFIAGMMYALIEHGEDWPLLQKLDFANELAGRKVMQEGFSGLGSLMQHTL